jgi:hypothetical protein
MQALINRRALLALVGGMATCGVHAVPLPPNDVAVINDGTSVGAEPQLAGTVVDQRSTRFHYVGWYQDSSSGKTLRRKGNVQGTVLSQVVLANDGTYDFYWQVQLAKQSFLPVAGFTLEGFGAGAFNVGWRSDSTGQVSPSYVNGQDGRITFHFGQYLPPSAEIYPGQQTYFFFIDTNAHAYGSNGSFSLLSERDSGGQMMIDWGGSSGPMQAFAPVFTAQSMMAPVPEPDSTLLSLAGLGTLAMLRRRRRA